MGGKGKYLMFKPTERSCAFRIRTLVGTGEDLVLGLSGRGGAHGGEGGREREKRMWRRGLGRMGVYMRNVGAGF